MFQERDIDAFVDSLTRDDYLSFKAAAILNGWFPWQEKEKKKTPINQLQTRLESQYQKRFGNKTTKS